MFEKVLIANRGAIAYRVIRTLKKMNIKSVAVFAEADRYSRHVDLASEAFHLGDGTAKSTYLDMQKIIGIAKECGARAIHPGYGFLSENAGFSDLCEKNGIAFLGPTAEQMKCFGLKHTARKLAKKSGVPLLPGTGLLHDKKSAIDAAGQNGFSLIIKSSAGGGIGMQVCRSIEQVGEAFDSVKRLSANNFGNDGVFLEKFIDSARHIEVQIFGDGRGNVVHLGERDCSTQRRNQKVVEETPAPGLTAQQRAQIWQSAVTLASSVNYRSAGTVEFLMDADSCEFYFLEINTRLQVVHGVTEEVNSVDLVQWMILAGSGDLKLEEFEYKPRGTSIQVRLYAEDPDRNFQPCTGILSHVSFPDELRVESWIKKGLEITPFFDPMLAKLIVHADTREEALEKLLAGLLKTKVEGVENNLKYLQEVLKDQIYSNGEMITSYLGKFHYRSPSFIILDGGTETTVQDLGRVGYWDIGVPPSGPMDELSFKLANQIVGNELNAAALEMTFQGPKIHFLDTVEMCLNGADLNATLNGEKVPHNQKLWVKENDVLVFGRAEGTGLRGYLAIAGGIDVPLYMGSRSTFTLGKFGVYKGRALNAGDKLCFYVNNNDDKSKNMELSVGAKTEIPFSIHEFTTEWKIKVMYGPHGSPDIFTYEHMEQFVNYRWEVHFNSSRTGVRLIGPSPRWMRKDGGEAGLHPSNIHDNAYVIGAVDFTGDMPIILGPDGPSLGGFVCPFTIIKADLWKIGQLKPGDHIQFIPVDIDQAADLEISLAKYFSSLNIY